MQFEPLGHRPFPLLSVHIHPVLPPVCPLHFIQRREREQVLLLEFRCLSAAVAPACADASVWTLTPCPLLLGTVLACLLLHLVFILYLSKIFFSPVFLIYSFFSFSFSFFLVILQSPTNRSI